MKRPAYESSIQRPITSSLFGDLIQLIFIQVQKQRVDIERAMLALDKLLKSNGTKYFLDLNFS